MSDSRKRFKSKASVSFLANLEQGAVFLTEVIDFAVIITESNFTFRGTVAVMMTRQVIRIIFKQVKYINKGYLHYGINSISKFYKQINI